MSSSRTTKRKRSKAGAPATSSTRERAAAEEAAHNVDTGKNTAQADDKNANIASSTSVTTASTIMENGSGTDTKALDDASSEGKRLDSKKQSAEEGGTKDEADNEEPISNGKSKESDNKANKSISDKTQDMNPSTSTSIDASSSSTSSQDGSSTRRQALHLANDDDDRETRMLDLISHRSILLDRIRACRESAENRIGEKSEGDNDKASADNLADEQEIAAFKLMTKQANQAARKNKELDGAGEKRTSLSLRRGSSVGKRMNAALSSLVPGSSISGTTSSGGNNASMGQSTTPKSSSISNPQSIESKAEAKGASPFTKHTTTKSSGRLPINSLSNDSSATPTQTFTTSIKSNKNHSPFPLQTSKQYDVPGRGRLPNSKSSKMMKTGGTPMGVPHALASAQNLKKNSALPMGVRSASMISSGMGPSLLGAKQGPKVNFPEAIALREKRDQIESKLRSLLERRQSNASLTSGKIMPMSSLEDDITRRKASLGSVGFGKPILNKKSLHPAMKTRSESGLEIPPPAPLPNRRRTHWDVVLQEMSWLASDFIEERKWKLSTSRLLSSRIPPHGLSDRRKRTSEANRASSENANRDVPADTNSKNSEASDDRQEDLALKKGDEPRKYSIPVTNDEEMAKCTSRILSCMISQLDAAIKKGGSLENADKYHQEALKSFVASRSNIIRQANDQIAEHFDLKINSSKEDQTDDSGREMSEDKSSQNESRFGNIDDYIKHFHNLCKSKHKLAAKETSKALKSGKIKLTGKQKEMLEFVDKLWLGKPHSGAVIAGSSTSGMTFGTATIIWKQRTQGPQILICPSRSLIRWKFELNRFSNIRVLTFGSTGGISNPDDDNKIGKIVSADVILCEYTSVNRMKSALKKMGEKPFSVIVDLRHFSSLRKSLNASMSASGDDFPLELLSNRWWGEIVSLVRSNETRCLLLEYYDTDPLSLSLCGLEQKEQISILAKRVACIIGPEVFGSGSHSIEREVIAWARKKGKKEISDKAMRVRKILQDTVKPMSFHISKPILSSLDLKWELRSCKMSTDQRKEYERCCNEVRGALSSSIEVSDSNRSHYSIPVVSNALFRLREECFYSRKHAMLSSDSHTMSKEKKNGLKHEISNFWANASQPDASTANSLLNSSSKLRELVSILTNEGGHNLDADEKTQKLVGISKGSKKGKDMKLPLKKIVILAALPTIQDAVSTLLNSLGVHNEHVCKFSAFHAIEKADDGGCSNFVKDSRNYEAIAWAKSQTILSRFGCDDHYRKTNIVIASPAVLSGRNDGIGIEGADIIITLDSDWSGRDSFIVNSLVRRWHAKNKLIGKEDRLIRLVSADSIEEKIFHDENEDNGVFSWPLDSDGFLTMPIPQDEASALYSKSKEDDSSSFFSFPATRVLQNRGLSLEDVLSSSVQLPSLFASGKPPIFLPKIPNNSVTDEKISAEIQFLKYFLQSEKIGFTPIKLTTVANLTATSQMSPGGLTSRNDLSVIESRLYLENLVHSFSISKDLEDKASTNVLRSNALMLNATQSSGEPSGPEVNENPSSLLFYEPYQDSFPTSDDVSKNELSKLDANLEKKTKRRYNAYAKLFSGSWNGVSSRDGNQGCEPLVFFPPLFPGLQEVSKKARTQYISSIEATAQSEGTASSTRSTEFGSDQKRKDRELSVTHNDTQHDSKRPKTLSLVRPDTNGYSGQVSSLGNKLPETSSNIPSNSKSELILQNGKVPLNPPTLNKGPNTTKSSSSGMVMVDEDFGLLGSGAFPTPNEATFTSAYHSKVNSSYTVSSWNRPDDRSNLLPCDTEEISTSALKLNDEGMQSVLLFVKKRPRATQPAYKHSQGLSSIVPQPIGSKTVGDDSVKKMKKRGAQGNAQVPPTAFTRLPSNSGTQQSQIISRTPAANSRQVKGDFRHKLLASFYSRQRATGLTLFDSVPYRVAAMRVEKRVMERLEKLMWKSTLALDAGPGLPIKFVESLFTGDTYYNDLHKGLPSIVDKLKDGSCTGTAAIAQSSLQRQEFKMSSVSPRCSDFGAFEVGYLSSPSGMTAMPAARRRVGVSLPMGVRLMTPTKDQEKRFAWDVRDDTFLCEAAKKFGKNWLLIASTMSGFERIIMTNLPGIENKIPAVAKSARQCRERWQLLIQNQPSLAKEVRNSETMFRERTFSNSKTVHNIEVLKTKALVFSAESIKVICKSDEFLNLSETKQLTSSADIRDDHNGSEKQNEVVSPRSTVDKQDGDALTGHASIPLVDKNSNEASGATEDAHMSDSSKATKPKRRSFSAIANARSRRQVFPVTIPGIDVGGNQPGHPVPSHPSHMQSVQISVAAQWSSGRTEMWPLQILDLADKQKSNAARMNNLQRGEIPAVHNSARRHPASNSSYQHRPQAPQPTAVRAPVGYSTGMNTASRPVAPRPVNPSVTPHHQHRSPPVASSTAQAYIPPPTATTGKSKKSDKQKPTNKSSPKKG